MISYRLIIPLLCMCSISIGLHSPVNVLPQNQLTDDSAATTNNNDISVDEMLTFPSSATEDQDGFFSFTNIFNFFLDEPQEEELDTANEYDIEESNKCDPKVEDTCHNEEVESNDSKYMALSFGRSKNSTKNTTKSVFRKEWRHRNKSKKPSPTKHKPSPTKAKPSPTKAKPSLTKAKPSLTKAKPSLTKAKPSLTKAKPTTKENKEGQFFKSLKNWTDFTFNSTFLPRILSQLSIRSADSKSNSTLGNKHKNPLYVLIFNSRTNSVSKKADERSKTRQLAKNKILQTFNVSHGPSTQKNSFPIDLVTKKFLKGNQLKDISQDNTKTENDPVLQLAKLLNDTCNQVKAASSEYGDLCNIYTAIMKSNKGANAKVQNNKISLSNLISSNKMTHNSSNLTSAMKSNGSVSYFTFQYLCHLVFGIVCLLLF